MFLSSTGGGEKDRWTAFAYVELRRIINPEKKRRGGAPDDEGTSWGGTRHRWKRLEVQEKIGPSYRGGTQSKKEKNPTDPANEKKNAEQLLSERKSVLSLEQGKRKRPKP